MFIFKSKSSFIIIFLVFLSSITNFIFLFNGITSENDDTGFNQDNLIIHNDLASRLLTKNQGESTENSVSSQQLMPSLDLPDFSSQSNMNIESDQSNNANFQVDDELTFWAVDYGLWSTTNNLVTSFYETNATVRAISTHSVIFVENTLLGTYNQTFANELATEFETNIWDSEVPYFGVPPDVDGDGRVTVLVMDIKDDFGGGSYIAGVFLRLHEYDPALYPNEPEIQYSMLMEIVHIDTRAISDGNANGTLAHEFQHLVHFNSDPDETVWIDEASSTYSSYKAGYFSDVAEYFSNLDSTYFLFNTDSSLTYWGGDVRDYATAFLFFLYLSERFGSNVIGEITNSTMVDQSSIVNILQTNYGYSGTFIDIFTDWTIANTLDIEGSADYGYGNFNLSARIPTKVSNYPKIYSESVTFWGTDIYEFNPILSPSNLRISFLGDISTEFSLSILTYSSLYSNWTVNSLDSSSLVNNELNIFIPKFSLNDNSKIILLISSVDGVSSGMDTVDELDYQSDYSLSAVLASTEIVYNQFDSSSQIVRMQGINIEDPLNLWNLTSIVYANYSIISVDSNKTVGELSYNLTYNGLTLSYELEVNKSLLLPGTYQIRILISNGTTILSLLSPTFEISFEDFAFFQYNSQLLMVTIYGIHLVALDPTWNISSILSANYSIINADTKEIIEGFSNDLIYNESSSTYELEVNISSILQGEYKIAIFISNGTSNIEFFSPAFEVIFESSSTTTSIPNSSSVSTTTTPTKSGNESTTNKSITTSPLFLYPLTIFLLFVASLIPILKRRKEKM